MCPAVDCSLLDFQSKRFKIVLTLSSYNNYVSITDLSNDKKLSHLVLSYSSIFFLALFPFIRSHELLDKSFSVLNALYEQIFHEIEKKPLSRADVKRIQDESTAFWEIPVL